MTKEIINKENKTIFELKACYIRLKYNARKEIFLPPSYPFRLSVYRIGIFSSLSAAEAAIQSNADLNKTGALCGRSDMLYCFYANEYRIDEMDWNHIVTCRSYLPDGKPEECCLTSSAYRYMYSKDVLRSKEPHELHSMGIFPGRKPEEIRFKTGDIVEVAEFASGRERVFLGILYGVPHTEEEVRSRFEFTLDDSDDCYCVLECFPARKVANHSHPQSTDLFAPRFEIPEKLKHELQAAYRSDSGKENTYEIH